MNTVLELRDVCKTFQAGQNVLHAVHNVSFALSAGDCFGLMGESGSGKSTVARMVGGLLAPTAGTVCFEGRELPPAGRAAIKRRRGIQMIFQNPYSSFSPKMTLRQALRESLAYGAGVPRSQQEDKIKAALRDVGLDASYGLKRCSELSGGECQRAAIARALLCGPRLLICDEITSALDVSVQAQIVDLLAKQQQKRKLALLFISHDIALVSCVCNRTAVMKEGAIVEMGPTKDLVENPQHQYTKELVNFYKMG